MDNKGLLVALVVLALAAVFFLFGGTDLFQGGSGGDGDTATIDEDDTALTAKKGAQDAETDEEPKSSGPVLFGRSRAELAGIGSLRGRVMDFDTSEGIARATVVIKGVGYGDEQTALQATTGEGGHFRYAELPAGDAYEVHVTDPKGRERTLTGAAVDANREEDVGVLWVGTANPLEGTVVDEGGLPVAGADVAIHEGGGSVAEMLRNLPRMMDKMDRDAVPVSRTDTDRTGRFAFETVEPGPYTLVVRASGYRLATQKVVMTSNGVAGGKPTVRVATSAPITGIVVDERNRPVEGARVACMIQNDMASIMYGRQYSRTDAGGRFVIDAPPTQGELSVIVAADGYPSLFTRARGGDQNLRFVLVAGVDVLLRIVDKTTERPVEGARLTAMFAETLTDRDASMTIGTGTTDQRGEVLVRSRPSKLQMLFLNHPDRGNAMFNPMMSMMGQGVVLSGPKDMTVKPPRTELVFRLATGVTVRGTVKTEEGTPLAGVRVATIGIMGEGGSTTTDGDGRYELKNQSPPILMVTAEAPGYVMEPRAGGMMGPSATQEVERDVVLKAAASVTGRVVDARGRGLGGVEVRIGGGGMAMFGNVMGAKQTITNTSGGYVLDGILPKAGLHVMGRVAGYIDSKTETFEVKSGAVQAPDLVMREGSRIVVKVVDADGRAVKGARIEVSVSATESIRWDVFGGFRGFADVATNAAGKADIGDLPDGTVTLTASKQGHAPGRTTVTTKHAETEKHDVELRLREAVTLEGRVLDEDGKPVKGALVQTLFARAAEEDTGPWIPRVSDRTGANGRFELKELPPVLVQIDVRAEGYEAESLDVDAGGRAIEIRLTKIAADVKKRMEAIDAEIQQIALKLGDAKDDAERAALGQRIMQLQQEKAKLEAKSEGPGR